MVYVENYEKVNPGQPIVSFLDLSTYKVVAWISEEDAKSVTKDTKFLTEIETADTTLRVGDICAGAVEEGWKRIRCGVQDVKGGIIRDVRV